MKLLQSSRGGLKIKTGRRWRKLDCFIKNETLSVFGQKKVVFCQSFYFQKSQKWIGSEKLKDQLFHYRNCVWTFALWRLRFLIFFNGEINFATNFFPSRGFLRLWIFVALQLDFIPANHHEDQFWPQMTWRENCCKHKKRAGITRLRKVHLDLELII